MPDTNYGSIALTDDRGYKGSRYSQVYKAIFANLIRGYGSSKDAPALPSYKVTLASVLGGILPCGKLSDLFKPLKEL
jgi:hypothetical protein